MSKNEIQELLDSTRSKAESVLEESMDPDVANLSEALLQMLDAVEAMLFMVD